MSEPESGGPGGVQDPISPQVLPVTSDGILERGASREPSRGALVVSLGAWLCVLAIHLFILIYVVPSFEQMFKDLGRDIPASTKLLIAISRAVRSPLGLMGMALVVLATIGTLRLPRRRIQVIVFNLLAFAAFLLLFAIPVALFLPLIEDIKSVGR